MKLMLASAFALTLVGSQAAAQSTDGGGTIIEGNTSISVTAKNVNTTVTGDGVAKAAIGSVTDSKIKGNTDIQVSATDINTSSKGGGSASAAIGSIDSADIKGNTTIQVSAEQVTTSVDGKGCAVALIGSIGTKKCATK